MLFLGPYFAVATVTTADTCTSATLGEMHGDNRSLLQSMKISVGIHSLLGDPPVIARIAKEVVTAVHRAKFRRYKTCRFSSNPQPLRNFTVLTNDNQGVYRNASLDEEFLETLVPNSRLVVGDFHRRFEPSPLMQPTVLILTRTRAVVVVFVSHESVLRLLRKVNDRL